MDMTGVYACKFEAVCDVTTVPSHLKEKKYEKRKKKPQATLHLFPSTMEKKKKRRKNDHELESGDIEESSYCKSRIFREHSIFVSRGSLTFSKHEIFVQPLTAADSPPCFEFLGCILFSYGSRRVQTIHYTKYLHCTDEDQQSETARLSTVENKTHTKYSGYRFTVLDSLPEPRVQATCDSQDFRHHCVDAKSHCGFFDII